MERTKYYLEDKDDAVRYRYSIFNDKGYTDKEYFKDFPTIFHLRSELIHNEKPHDVRLVYLALLNMFKHRGHFLTNGIDTTSDIRSIQDVYSEFVSATNSECDLNFPEERVDFERIMDLLFSLKMVMQ